MTRRAPLPPTHNVRRALQVFALTSAPSPWDAGATKGSFSQVGPARVSSTPAPS